MKKAVILALAILISGCGLMKPAEPTPDVAQIATQVAVQMWLELSVKQTLEASMPTATPEPTPTSTPQPTPNATPLPPPASPDEMRFSADGMQLVYIPAGEFKMGSTEFDQDREEDETPQHLVYLDAFWMGKTQVTNAMFNACVAAGACAYSASLKTNPNYLDPLFASHPVVYVSWQSAQDYCSWVGGRLPTEAQWEKAARGPDGAKYPWGEEPPRIKFTNSNNEIGNTTAVGQFPYGASYYGVFEMGSNVREWAWDWYGAAYYQVSPRENPQGPETGEAKVLKGAAYSDSYRYTRPANRLSHEPGSPGAVRGFRCAFR